MKVELRTFHCLICDTLLCGAPFSPAFHEHVQECMHHHLLFRVENTTVQLQGSFTMSDQAYVAKLYPFLDDPAERAWLVNVSPTAVRDNAHRMYDFMRETGQSAESFIRELAFEKTAAALSISYDVLYNAWLNETPAS